MLYLLVADTHLGLGDASNMWHGITLKLFQSVVDTCHRKNIDTIIILGDFFTERKYLNIKTLNIALKIGEMLNEFKTYIITGNHDVFYKDRLVPSSLEVFHKFNNIKIINEPYVLDNMLLLPWQSELPKNITKFDTVMGHFAINSFYTNDSYVYNSKDGLNISDFKKVKNVLSGHFHNPMKKDNITYLGSPYQQRFGDSDSPRGYYIYDGKNLELIEFKDAPKFIKIYTNEKIIRKNIEGHFVKVIFTRDYGKIQNNRIIENIQLYKPLQLHTDFTKIQSGTTKEKYVEDDIKLKNKNEIMNDYINMSNLPDHIKKLTLKKVIEKLMATEEDNE